MAQISSRISQRALAADKSNAAVADFYFNSRYSTQHGDGGIADFTFGKPHEMPCAAWSLALTRAAEPKDNICLQVERNGAASFPCGAACLELGLPFEPEDSH